MATISRGGSQQRTPARRGAGAEYGLVELRRDHARCRAGGGAGDFRPGLLRFSWRRVEQRNRGMGAAGRTPRAQQVTLRSPKPESRKLLPPMRTGAPSSDLPAKIELWSPGNPKLYDVTVSAGADTVRDGSAFARSKLMAPRSAERKADFSARHLHARGSAQAWRPGV